MELERIPPHPQVTVVSVTYNRCADMLSLLSQLDALDYPRDQLRIVLVDNASTDGTAERVRQDYPWVELLVSPRNTGVARGFNQGLRHVLDTESAALSGTHSTASYIWLLDSDAEVEPGTLRPLVDALRGDASIGIVGSAVYDPLQRERLVTAGLRVNWKTGNGSFVLPSRENPSELIDVDLIPACSLLVRSDLCRALGLWDERLRLYWGDTDWCTRFLRAGFRVCCCTESRAWHRDWSTIYRGFSAPAYIHDHLRGALVFHVRHNPDHSLAGTQRLIVASYLRGALEQLTMRLGFSRAYDLAVRDFLSGSFCERGNESLLGCTLLPNLNCVCDELARYCPKPNRWIISGIDSPLQKDSLKAHFEKRFGEIAWRELSPDGRRDRPGEWSEFRIIRPWQILEFFWRLLLLPFRADVLVAEISSPHLSHLALARYTVLLNQCGEGIVYRNRVIQGLSSAVANLARGLRTAYIDLPRATKGATPLMSMISDGSQR
jgi:GT2 family glycosyltransferase